MPVSGQIQYGSGEGLTSRQTPHAPPAEDPCHVTVPVRFGRRKTDQVGHLVLTSTWLKFCGRVELHVAWGEVARVEQTGAQMMVFLHEPRRVLCFCCQNDEEASRGAVVAMHLATLAQSESYHSV